MLSMLTRLLGTRNDRLIKQMQKIVVQINELESNISALSDPDLAGKTPEFKTRLAAGESLQNLLPEAFAVVREASRRMLGLRHYDVQLIGGIALHQGKIAEMKTGEGKTLVATLPLYLNALSGKGVHLVTVNDYLVNRDAEMMSKVYGFLGLSTGTITSTLSPTERRRSYACDITYGTNTEFGFDYLRDNMAFSLEEQVQRELNFALVDEVDSILIDEARTPLIISGVAQDQSEIYRKLNVLIPRLTKREQEEGPGDYSLDEKTRQAHLTEAGHGHLETILAEAGLLPEKSSLYDSLNINLMHYVNAVLRAHTLFFRDVDYMMRGNEVLIVDEHTGRAMPGRRWSDGLHQAIEAKEGVMINAESQTLASITYQNYFRSYQKLAGMTGTADTEAFELHQIYNLEVLVIPTHHPMIRKDFSDVIFLTAKEKYQAIVKEIKECVAQGRPVLVGTSSIESSEQLSGMLTQEEVSHHVLNAKQHEKEAAIIAQAGRPQAVTIATNMAGRGTDIILGGNWHSEIAALGESHAEAIGQIKTDWQARHDRVFASGGLHVLGCERHESRRIDNQLRGRSGRQGDPGSSRFYLSVEDNLLRIFTPPWIQTMLRKAGMGNGEALEHRLINKQIAKAQKRVEGHHFDVRKNLLQFDDIANDQRKIIYTERTRLLKSSSVAQMVHDLRLEVVRTLVNEYFVGEHLNLQDQLKLFQAELSTHFELSISTDEFLPNKTQLDIAWVVKRVVEEMEKARAEKSSQVSSMVFDRFEKTIVLKSLDNHWREHLAHMDYLRNSIHLRGYAQKDPKQEYKKEAFELFFGMLSHFRKEVVSLISCLKLDLPNESPPPVSNGLTEPALPDTPYLEPEFRSMVAEQSPSSGLTVGRNEPCPCGSLKKYRHCHGVISS